MNKKMSRFELEFISNKKYSGLHENWPFAYFEKITVVVGWVYIKVCGSNNETFENLKVTRLLDMISGMPKL